MPKRRRPKPEDLLGPLEAVCMRSLWQRSPARVADVLETVHARHDPDTAYTTVMTVLSRLHEKGYVTREHVGRGYLYQPAYREKELVDLLGRRDVDELVDRYGPIALAHFVETLRETNPDVLAQIRELAHETDHA